MFLTPKKKESLLTASTKAISSSTPEDHVLKQLSLRYFVDQSLTIREVAKRLNTTPKKVKSFFEDPEYADELKERIDKVHGIGTDFMQSQAKISLLHLYEEMRRREVEGELQDIPLRELHKILIDTQREIRLDTPGAFTSKVGVADLSALQDRYSKSLSGRFHRLQKTSNILDEKAVESDTLSEIEEGRLLEEGSLSVEDEVENGGAR